MKFGHIASFGRCFFRVLGVEFHGGSSVAKIIFIRRPEDVEMKSSRHGGVQLCDFAIDISIEFSINGVNNFSVDFCQQV